MIGAASRLDASVKKQQNSTAVLQASAKDLAENITKAAKVAETVFSLAGTTD